MNMPANEATNQGAPRSKPMSLDEARKVMWLRNNFRPLGELLDEGYLDQGRLEWAAAKADDPGLKEAAQVLLDWQKNSFSEPPIDKKAITLPSEPSDTQLPVGITIEQARATVWPLPGPYRGQAMGMLVETRRLSLKDLGYAIENAWKERVRQASIALMLVRLNQAVKEPLVSAGFLHVESGGRSFMERMRFLLTLFQGLIFGIVLASCFIPSILLFSTRQLTTHPSKPFPDLFTSPLGIVILAILLVLIAGLIWLFHFLFDWFMKRLDKQIENYRVGQDGEDRVVEVMRQSLDGNWFLFRNITLPGRKKMDLDAVLVGSSGVWALEVKTLTGEYRNIGEHWEYRAGNRWKLSTKSPSRQANANAAHLSNFLKVDGIKQWVTPAVVWANKESSLTVENPATAVWSLERLPDELGNVWHDEVISEDKRKRIVEKLTKLCSQKEKVQ
ncbi:MAG: nuclease-related domain-containing protein [bacterium]